MVLPVIQNYGAAFRMVSTCYRFRFSNGSRDGIRHKVDVLLAILTEDLILKFTKHRNILLKLFMRLIKTKRLRKGI
jgi:hypothetical protein